MCNGVHDARKGRGENFKGPVGSRTSASGPPGLRVTYHIKAAKTQRPKGERNGKEKRISYLPSACSVMVVRGEVYFKMNVAVNVA